jgi:hypothetical protein
MRYYRYGAWRNPAANTTKNGYIFVIDNEGKQWECWYDTAKSVGLPLRWYPSDGGWQLEEMTLKEAIELDLPNIPFDDHLDIEY